jgi:protein-disulfide isomerase
MDETASRHPSSNVLIPASIVIAGVIIAAAIVYVSGSDRPGRAVGPAVPSAGGAAAAAAVLGNLADDDPSLGSPSAAVSVVEFGDFQCPFCNRFFREAEREIIETYVKTGQVRFVYRDFAFLGDESVAAAEAAECADEQGTFWPYHDRLYNFIWDTYFAKGQNGENVGAFSTSNLQRLAAEVGLDTARFSECFSSRRYRAEVEKDIADGRAAGASGTPTTFINGRMLVGALPFSQFASAIEEALAGK